MGHSPAGLFGYSHLTGGYAGGQAEYLRVPHADVGCLKIESDLPDDKVLFLSDIFPQRVTWPGRTRTSNPAIRWPFGAVARWAVLHPERVDVRRRARDRHRPRGGTDGHARDGGQSETIDFTRQDVYETLQDDGWPRPDRCIDPVGAEAHGTGGVDAVVDKLKAAVKMTTDRAHVLRQAIYCCRKAGTISVPGVYIGFRTRSPWRGS